MSWLVRDSEEAPTLKLRKLLNKDKRTLQVPGTHDALAGLLAKKCGFEVLYLSGGAFSASMGLPDVGLFTITELANRTREICHATGLPIIVDIDHGSTSILNLTRLIKEIHEAGAAAIQIEDQDLPRKCGHLNGKKLIPKDNMVQKIKAVKRANNDIVVIARTDAKAVEGVEKAIYRAKAYEAAGADVIFPEALQTEEEFKLFSSEIKVPLLANMTEFGKTPYFNIKEFEEWGYKIVIYPVSSLRVAAKAIENLYNTIKEKGTQESLVNQMQSRKELYETIRYFDYEDLDNSIAKTFLEN